MLASIHPLGERARHNRWVVTAAAYTAGSTAAAALLGGLLGGAGVALRGRVPTGAGASPGPATWVLAVAAVVCCLAAAWDAGAAAVPLPTVRRQVNEDWLGRYRGWVYGVGFGAQLGLGVVTIVTTASVYAALILALLAGRSSAGIGAGALAGTVVLGTFGLVRAVPVLVVMGRVRRPQQLGAVHRALAATARPARRLATAGLLVTAGALALAVPR